MEKSDISSWISANSGIPLQISNVFPVWNVIVPISRSNALTFARETPFLSLPLSLMIRGRLIVALAFRFLVVWQYSQQRSPLKSSLIAD